MKLRTPLILFVALLLLLLSAPTAAATDTGAVVAQEVETEMQTADEPVEILVTLEEPRGVETKRERKRAVGNSQRALIDHVESNQGIRVLKTFWISNAVLVEVEPSYDYEKLTRVGEVRSLKPNTEIETLGSGSVVSSDSGTVTGAVTTPTAATTTTATDTTYGMEQINAPDVWSQHGTKGGGVNVAVLDTGVNVSHPDIDLRTTDPSDPTYPGGWAEFDSQGNRVSGSEPYDSHGHGTHVSGTVGGEHTGVAPEANLMHGLILNGNTGTLSQALSGVEWAIDNDADVVSMSIGGGTEDVWADVARNANDMGVVVVSSVGNGGAGTSASPGNVYDVIGVGAVDENLNVASFSGGEVIDTEETWGDSALDHWPSEYVVPDVVSAGVNVNSTYAGGGYTFSSGTSMSAPHVAGAAALALSASGSHSPEEVRESFSITAFGSGSEEPGTRYGHGAADALAVTDLLIDGASVSGTVVDSTGTTVTDAEVRVKGVRVDDTNGGYEVGLAQGSWSIEATAPGYKDTTETVSLSQDESATKDIVLEEADPAFFEVSDLTGPTEAEPGEDATVTANVRNTGDKDGTQDVTLRLTESGGTLDGSTVVATRSDLSLTGGESETVGFSLEAPGEEGSYEYGVFSADDSESRGLTVEEPEPDADPAYFEVDSLDAPRSVEPGKNVGVTAKVSNTGGSSETQDVTLRLAEAGTPLRASTVVATEDVSLGSDENTTVGFTVGAPDEEGSYDYGVFSDDGSKTGSLAVREAEPPFFEVSEIDGQSEAEPNGSLFVTTKLRNTGGSGKQDVTLRLAEEEESLDDDSVVEKRGGVTLSAGASTTVGFFFEAPGEEGSYVYGVFTDNDDETETLTVGGSDADPAYFEVDGLDAPAEVGAGENASVNATVRNTGGVSGTQEVTFRLNESGEPLDDGAVAATEAGVNLDAGGETTVEFTVSAPDVEGDYRHGVFTNDDDETANLTVEGTDDGTGEGNPFTDVDDDPVERETVIQRIVEWNLNGNIDGTEYTRDEIIQFVVDWNLSQN